ncbi:hypothetical protein ACGFX8_37145 [Streptomyces sp. NPDC048362]|uniref:hypothetical protein n=1 Tax=Streptomyces sp. NPDC048362 TaxID=3365539 RepID=UPI00371383B8
MPTRTRTVIDLLRAYQGKIHRDDHRDAEDNFRTLMCYPEYIHQLAFRHLSSIPSRESGALLLFGQDSLTKMRGGWAYKGHTDQDNEFMPFFDPESARVFVPNMKKYSIPLGRVKVLCLALHELGHVIDAALGYVSQSAEFQAMAAAMNAEALKVCDIVREEAAIHDDLVKAYGYLQFGSAGSPRINEEWFAEGLADYYAHINNSEQDLKHLDNPKFLGPTQPGEYVQGRKDAAIIASIMRQNLRGYFAAFDQRELS